MAEKEWVWRTPSWVPNHTEAYLTEPETAHLWDSTRAGGPGLVPSLLLTTIGRRSGEPRHSPLIYGAVGDSFCVIASKGGYRTHPDWYVNLVAQPRCEVRVAGAFHHVVARAAVGDERESLWQHMRGIYPPFDDYKARTDREIPVIVLDIVNDG